VGYPIISSEKRANEIRVISSLGLRVIAPHDSSVLPDAYRQERLALNQPAQDEAAPTAYNSVTFGFRLANAYPHSGSRLPLGFPPKLAPTFWAEDGKGACAE